MITKLFGFAFRIALIGFVAMSLPAAEPILEPKDEAFLLEQARRVVASARMEPQQSAGNWTNTTPYTVHVPGGNIGYHAFWPRDAAMMLGGDLVSGDDIEDWIRLTASIIPGPEDWHVREGVVVPAYAVPDHINLDGKPTFYPGNYETGDQQGGPPWGKYPPLDDYFYFLITIYHHWKATQDLSLFESLVSTSWGEMKLSQLAERVYRAVPADVVTGLVVAGDVDEENAKDFGFCDGVFKSGKLLFPSVLKFIAADKLSQLFTAAGKTDSAQRFAEDVRRLKRAIPLTFYQETRDSEEGWLHSATGVGNQPDVWGSAFAIWSGAVDGATAHKVGRALVRAYREKTAVREGFVRHILTTDAKNNGAWEKAISEAGTYQNGGYWGTPTGWYISAIHGVDRKAAADMAKDYVQFLRSDMRPDGVTQAWEWFNPDTKTYRNDLYVASVALPYLSLKEFGLVSAQAQ